ncbi:type II toxin-antitoxin system PemK/MazF family toxin [Sulfuricurvum sp.]|uniref:type II toxin-antitoxin system PemK/MazF family toxin n=1 Tax=Sulfuricurvum sp. TaxID=2025608 RepID=UPI0025D75390|nr:type II toxin-antitoxin system PemK/MazF family toxin [Sulfuricurvum sp.]
MSKRFDEWNETKKTIHAKTQLAHFREREIYVSTMGSNVGFEQDGKGEDFVRPVLVLRKFSKHSFIGVPLTSVVKEDIFHCPFSFVEGKKSYAILSQVRLFDAKRLERKMGMIHEDDFNELKMRLKELMKL